MHCWLLEHRQQFDDSFVLPKQFVWLYGGWLLRPFGRLGPRQLRCRSVYQTIVHPCTQCWGCPSQW